MWKYPRRGFAYGAVLLVAAGLLAGCGSSKPRKQTQGSVVVKADKAGTYQLGDLTVTVPAGAVPRDTRLSATKPVVIDRQSAPLGAASVQFDLSFAGGLEPAKPLDIAIPLRGGYLPNGANPAQALLYTPALDGRGQRLVPATVDGNNVLHAQLGHLSPKTVTYADDQTLMNLAGVGAPNSTTSPSDCQVSVTTPTGKVQFTSANKNWSSQGNSPVFACLALDGSNAKLSVINRLSYILAVASTDGLTLSTNSGDAEEELVKKLADKMFPPDKAIKTYLGRDDVLTTPLPPASLPATVQLKADPSTFLAEAAWSSLKFIVTLVTTATGDERAKLLDEVLAVPDTINCLTSTLKISQGNVPNLGDVYRLVTSKCTEKIAELLGEYAASKTIWEEFWSKFFLVGEIAGTIHSTLTTALTGISMQFNGTVSVVVDKEVSLQDRMKPFVGEWHAMRSIMRINANGTGSLNWVFPNQTIRTVAGSADIVFKASQKGVVGTYNNVSYRYVGGQGTPSGKMPFRTGDTFELTSRDASLLQNGSSYWCRSDTPYSFQQMNCSVP